MRRAPDFVIGPPENPYMHRWFVIPRNRIFNVYLHKFLRDDDDRALHDHPWPSVSLVLKGGYYEQTKGPDGSFERRWFGPGNVIFRGPRYAHRVELGRRYVGGFTLEDVVPCWTLFVTGPRVREWGFHCPKRWVPWTEFVDQKDHGNIGKGCGE